jgi:hypothetical protein
VTELEQLKADNHALRLRVITLTSAVNLALEETQRAIEFGRLSIHDREDAKRLVHKLKQFGTEQT